MKELFVEIDVYSCEHFKINPNELKKEIEKEFENSNISIDAKLKVKNDGKELYPEAIKRTGSSLSKEQDREIWKKIVEISENLKGRK